jgi:hypothetical protein
MTTTGHHPPDTGTGGEGEDPVGDLAEFEPAERSVRLGRWKQGLETFPIGPDGIGGIWSGFHGCLRCIEVPVHYRSRLGESKITGSFKRAFRLGLRMITLIIAYRFKRLPRLSSTVPEEVLIEIGEYWRVDRRNPVSPEPARPPGPSTEARIPAPGSGGGGTVVSPGSRR